MVNHLDLMGSLGNTINSSEILWLPFLCDLFSEPASSSSFPQEMLKALIVVLPTPVKYPTMPQNFRPISLLNADLKLYAKILASRLMTIIPSLIDQEQAEFLRGRQSSDDTRRLINITHLAKVSGTPSLLLYLNAEKAFDRVHWGYLQVVLTKCGSTYSILSDIMALYSVPAINVFVAEMLSSQFKITNGM